MEGACYNRWGGAIRDCAPVYHDQGKGTYSWWNSTGRDSTAAPRNPASIHMPQMWCYHHLRFQSLSKLQHAAKLGLSANIHMPQMWCYHHLRFQPLSKLWHAAKLAYVTQEGEKLPTGQQMQRKFCDRQCEGSHDNEKSYFLLSTACLLPISLTDPPVALKPKLLRFGYGNPSQPEACNDFCKRNPFSI